jgi:predicted HicB family RNase H-like nuclease
MAKEPLADAARQVPPDTETSRTIIVRLAAATHKILRVRVAEEDTSIQKWVETLIERELGLTEPDRKSRRA